MTINCTNRGISKYPLLGITEKVELNIQVETASEQVKGFEVEKNQECLSLIKVIKSIFPNCDVNEKSQDLKSKSWLFLYLRFNIEVQRTRSQILPQAVF